MGKGPGESLSGNALRWAGVVVAALYWVLESLLEILVYGGGFVAHLLPNDPDELWMRSIIAGFFVVCGFAAQVVLDRRRGYETELRRTEERYRTVIDTAQDAIVTMTEDGLIQSFNRAAELAFGHTEREVVGRPLTVLMPERFGERHESGLRRYLQTREPHIVGRTVELAGLRKSGEEFPLELSLAETREGGETMFAGIIRDITSRKIAESALRESEQRYQLVARATNDVIWDSDLASNELKWTGAVQTMFGYSTDEVRAGEWWEDRIHPEDRQRVVSGIERTLESGDIWTDEYRFRCGDGSYASVMDRAFVIRDERGEAARVIGSMMDVTERKQAEGQLRRAELRYRTLVERLPAVVYTQKPGHPSLTTYISPQIEKLQGYTPEEIIEDPDHWVRDLHPDDLDRVLAEDARTNETGEPFKMEYRVLSKDGRVIWVRDEAEMVGGDAGEPLFWRGIMTDITRRKQDEDEIRRLNEDLERQVASRTSELNEAILRLQENELVLRESEERFRATFEQAAVGIAHVAVDGRWLRVNQKLCNIVGYTREELLGLSFQDITHPDDLDRDLDQFRRLLAGEIQIYSIEKRYFRKDGSLIWINLTVSVVRGQDGEPEHAVSVIEDITDRRHAEDSLKVLVETSAVLTASLDYRTTLADLARLVVVPGLADWCAVDVLDERGMIRRLAVEHQDPEKVSLAHELQRRYPSDPDAPGGTPRVLREGVSEFYPDITDEMLVASARDPEHLELLREVGFTSLMIVPLLARGKTLGAITLVSAESGRRFTDSDLELARVLGRRAALTVDNARLYEEAQEEIRERKRTEEELRNSRDQLDIILRGVGDGITAQDPTGRLIYANVAAARIIGYPTVEEFLRTPLDEVMSNFEVMDEDGLPFPLSNLPGRKAITDRESGSELLRFRDRQTGQERWTFVSAAPVLGDEGEVRFAVNIFRDITDRMRAEETVREVREAERNRLARDLHDVVLQDMIDAMHSLEITQMKAADAGIKTELEGQIEALERSVMALRNSIYNLRLHEGQEYPFISLLEALVNLNRQRNPDCEIEFEVEDSFPDSLSQAGGVELMNVIREALVNVRRHSGATRARLLLSLAEGRGRVVVSDNGRGFDPSFVRSSTGLSAMRERAANLRGEIYIQSDRDIGTTVVIDFSLDALLPDSTGARR